MEIYAKNFGQIGALLFIVAFSFFLVKLYNKNLKRSVKEKLPSIEKIIENITKIIIKIHKPIGLLAFTMTVIHFYLMYSSGKIKYSGLFAITFMTLIVITGVLKGLVKKMEVKKRLQKAHLIIAFILLAAILLHLIVV